MSLGEEATNPEAEEASEEATAEAAPEGGEAAPEGDAGAAPPAPAPTDSRADEIIRTLTGETNIDMLLDVPMKASVELGASKLFIKEVLDLVPGSIIELNRSVGDPVDLLVNGRLVARGEVVVVDDNFGFRISDFVRKDELKQED